MSVEPIKAGPTDTATKLLTLISLAIGIFAAWKALPIDADIKRLQADTAKLELSLKQADADLKSIESNRKVTMELYEEVKKILENEKKNPREEEAVRVLVESLADDPFRWKLLQVLAVGATAPEVKQAAAETSKYYEEDMVKSVIQSSSSTSENVTKNGIGTGQFNVDLFFCESKRATSEPIVKAALSLKGKTDLGRWRVRLLPESINQQPGYGIGNNEVRFTPPEERGIAEALANALRAKGLDIKYHEIAYPTPNYVSVFICQ